MKNTATMERITFTFELLKNFNRKDIEATIETQDTLYVIELSRINELKADVARYILAALDDDSSYFMWYSAKANQKLAELYDLGCDGAIERFFTYGRWT